MAEAAHHMQKGVTVRAGVWELLVEAGTERTEAAKEMPKG